MLDAGQFLSEINWS